MRSVGFVLAVVLASSISVEAKPSISEYSFCGDRYCVLDHPAPKKFRQRYEYRDRSFQSASKATARGCLHPSAQVLLAGLEARFGSVKLVKTCVPGARIAGSGRPSYHGGDHRAFDFKVPHAGSHRAIMGWLATNSPGVTISYSGRLAGIIHTDTGPYHKVVYR